MKWQRNMLQMEKQSKNPKDQIHEEETGNLSDKEFRVFRILFPMFPHLFVMKWWCWGWNSNTLATHAKSWLIGKYSDARRDWGQEEKGTTEDEMAGWHHWLNECEFEWTPGVGDGQGGLACYDSWGRKESDTTERLNWSELNWWDQMPWF